MIDVITIVAIHISAHPKENAIVYTSGKFVVFKNLDDPTLSFVYRGHNALTTVAKISPNGYWCASADTAGKLRVWSVDNPEHLTKLEYPAFNGPIRDVDWGDDCKKIVVVGEGTGVCCKIITWDTGNSAGDMPGHSKKVLSCAFKPTRPYRIMTSGEDFKSCFYQGPPFKFVTAKQSFTNFANCIRYSPDGAHVVCVGEKKIQLYDGASGDETIALANAHEGTIYSVSWAPDSTKIATASADKKVKIFNLALECLVTHTFGTLIRDMQMSVVWTKTKLVSVSLSGDLTFLNTEAPGALAPPVQDHQDAISSVCYSPSTGILYTGDNKGVLISRNLETGVAVRITSATSTANASPYGAVHNLKITALAVVGDTLISVGFDDRMRFTKLDATAMDADEVVMNGQPQHIATLAGSPLFAVSTTKEVGLFTGRARIGGLELPQDKFTAKCTAFNSETEFAIGCSDYKTRIYSIASDLTFTNTATIETRSAVLSLAFRPSFDFLAIGDDGRQVEVYESGSWAPKIKSIWTYHTSKVTCLAWSPNGALIASGSVDESLIIWDFNTPAKKLIIPFAHSGGVNSLLWVDDARLVSVGNDYSVVTWNIPAAL